MRKELQVCSSPHEVCLSTDGFQETYGKLLDNCLLASRSYDQSSWIRRTRGDIVPSNGRISPAPRSKPIVPLFIIVILTINPQLLT